MEHTCHRCGANIEEGVPFCPQCGAPQIRVSTPSTELGPPPGESPGTPPLPPGTPDSVQPPAEPVPLAPPPPPPTKVDWSVGVRIALLAGIGIGVLVSLPLLPTPGAVIVLCCLWTLLGGALAANFYRRRVHAATITTDMGARLGALAGFFAFLTASLLAAIRMLFLGGDFRAALEQAMRQQNNPELERILASGGGLALLLAIGLVMQLFGFVLFTAVGGALGASLFKGKRQ